MRKVIIRVDGNSTIGLGHVSRCLALGEILRPKFDICFVIRDQKEKLSEFISKAGFNMSYITHDQEHFEDEAEGKIEWFGSNDIVVLDGYQFSESYIKKLYQKSFRLVCIDDNARIPYAANAVINHNAHAKNLNLQGLPETKFFLGTDYLMLRKEFFNSLEKSPIRDSLAHILLCFGGADSNNITSKILKILERISFISTIHIIIGPQNTHAASLKQIAATSSKKVILLQNLGPTETVLAMKKADLIISTASMMAWEAVALKTPLLTGWVAANQRLIAKFLGDIGAALNIGHYCDIEEVPFTMALEKFQTNKAIRERMLTQQRELIDGKSYERILHIFENL